MDCRNAAGAGAGKVVGIVGKGSTDGLTKGNDGLGIGRGDPDWDKKFGENPPKGWVEAGGEAKGNGSEAPYNPQTTRNELESVYGREDVISTTVPPVDGRNVHLAGRRHPVTGGVFDNRGFPIFDDVTAFDTRISIDAFKSTTYEGQMKLATKELSGAIQQGQVRASSFTAKQLQQINAGAKKIDGYTWHHHQDSGRMQLVPGLIIKKRDMSVVKLWEVGCDFE